MLASASLTGVFPTSGTKEEQPAWQQTIFVMHVHLVMRAGVDTSVRHNLQTAVPMRMYRLYAPGAQGQVRHGEPWNLDTASGESAHPCSGCRDVAHRSLPLDNPSLGNTALCITTASYTSTSDNHGWPYHFFIDSASSLVARCFLLNNGADFHDVAAAITRDPNARGVAP